MWLFYEATAQEGNTRENLLITVFLDTFLPIHSFISRVFNRCRLTYICLKTGNEYKVQQKANFLKLASKCKEKTTNILVIVLEISQIYTTIQRFGVLKIYFYSAKTH